MTPRIMRNSADYAETMRKEFIKTTINLDDAMAINGSMGLYDPLTQRGKTQGAVRSLPFLEMDKLDEVPPSTHRPYNPSNDYPASGPAVSNPNAVMPPVETLPDGVTRQTQRAGSVRSAE